MQGSPELCCGTQLWCWVWGVPKAVLGVLAVALRSPKLCWGFLLRLRLWGSLELCHGMVLGLGSPEWGWGSLKWWWGSWLVLAVPKVVLGVPAMARGPWSGVCGGRVCPGLGVPTAVRAPGMTRAGWCQCPVRGAGAQPQC